MDFIQYPLLFQDYPSQPSNEMELSPSVNKKPRRILKAKRHLKKSSQSVKGTAGGSPDRVPDPKALQTTRKSSRHIPSVAYRAIQQTYNRKYRKVSIRQSDILFLENERLCGIGTNTEIPKEIIAQTPQHNIRGIIKLNATKERTLQKRKILNSTDNVSKKRRTLDGDKDTSTTLNIIPLKTLERDDNTTQPFKPKVMPNFARIFKVQSENTENIVEYKQRKAVRAANLLSGAKLPVKSTTTRVATSKMKRELTFTTENSPNIDKLPKLPKQHIKSAGSDNLSNKTLKVQKITAKKVNFIENNIKKRSASGRTPLTSSTPCIQTTVPLHVPKTHNINSNHIIKKDNINKFGFRQDNRPNCLNLAQIQTIAKRSPVLNAAEKSSGKAKNLFEIKPSRVKKDELVKAVLTKTRSDRDMVASTRHEIKGVRLNRRFQLLMQMRSDKP